jgi:hypothetical protein
MTMTLSRGSASVAVLRSDGRIAKRRPALSIREHRMGIKETGWVAEQQLTDLDGGEELPGASLASWKPTRPTSSSSTVDEPHCHRMGCPC